MKIVQTSWVWASAWLLPVALLSALLALIACSGQPTPTVALAPATATSAVTATVAATTTNMSTATMTNTAPKTTTMMVTPTSTVTATSEMTTSGAVTLTGAMTRTGAVSTTGEMTKTGAMTTTAATTTTGLAELVARAVLPADTFAEGPVSGSQIDPKLTLSRTVPFKSQPVQGFSAVLDGGNGAYLVMADNGYGAKGNSADFNLRFYQLRPSWKTADGGAGAVEVLGFTQLHDPDHKVPFTITNQTTADRVLTGADFDIESFRKVADGTFWFGEELGPYLLHVDAQGKVLAAPIPLPLPKDLAQFGKGQKAVMSPDNPAFVSLPNQDARKAAANLGSSRGFEGMALSADGKKLYPLLEGALVSDTVRTRLLISEFELDQQQYTDQHWYYRLEDAKNSIGDMTAINDHEFLVIERDQNQGAEAKVKRIYKIDISKVDGDGFVTKQMVVDLLNIADPKGISGQPQADAIGLGNPFTFPFVTIEDVLIVDPSTLLVINDNNYPFSTGRRKTQSDDNEFIKLHLSQPLNVTAHG